MDDEDDRLEVCKCGAENDNKKLIILVPVCCILGMLIGGIFIWDSSKPVNNVFNENDRKHMVEQAWSDGVMWGALAMKNMTENQQSTTEFGSVYQVAKDLKTEFSAQKILPPPAPILSTQTFSQVTN